jgi:hypothetical protein
VLTSSDSAIKGGRPPPCHRNHRYLVSEFADACRDVHPAFWEKFFFQRWILSGGIMSAFAKGTLQYILVGGRRAQSKMTVEPHSADRKSLL